MFDFNDTIAAISSPPGNAIRGILRLSGPEAFDIALTIFIADKHLKIKDLDNRSRARGHCTLGDNIIVAGCAYIFRAGHSYTAENMVEIHTSGNQTLLQMLLNQLINNGARLAGAGEFTARAFFNGRIDLTEAQAVAAMIHSQSDAQLRASERLLQGQLHKIVDDLSTKLAQILALLEANIDFSQEQIEFADNNQLSNMLENVLVKLQQTLCESIIWQDIQKLPQVVIAGPANAGKSSLTNKLLGMDRAIVSSIAGTTRDLLSAPLQLSKSECILIDTAGLGEVLDPLAGQTQNLARQALENCDLLLWMVDPTIANSLANYPPADLKLPKNVITLVGKADLFADAYENIKKEFWLDYCKNGWAYTDDFLPVSPLSDFNVQAVRDIIEKTLITGDNVQITAMTVTLTVAQRQALFDAADALENAREVLDMHEIAAFEIRLALDYLGSITGYITADDILGQIFSQFCIGK